MTLVLLLAAPAMAGDPGCEALCRALDAAEEACEARYGDDDETCSAIGKVEESCDPEDGGTTETCPTLCADADALDDACDARLGEGDPVCQALDAIAEDCEDGTYDGAAPPETDDDDDDDDDDEANGGAQPSNIAPTGDGTAADASGCATSPAAPATGLLGGLLALVGVRRGR